MNKRKRQSIGILAAIVIYYLIHEGAHLITALYYDVFRQINFMGLGIQIDVYADRMTNFQLGTFCLAGPLAALALGWLTVLLRKKICCASSMVFKTVMWYTSLALLLPDPLYLSFLYRFFGGGDMNGIRLLFPESTVRIVFTVIGILHGIVIWKYLLPEYTNAFEQEN